MLKSGTGNEVSTMTKQIKVIVEKHPDGYVAYPLGLRGIVVGEGDTYEEAIADVRSAIRFHIETFWTRRLSFVMYRRDFPVPH